MKLSARNQLKGTVTKVAEGTVNGVMTIDLGGAEVTADITMTSIADLNLSAGKEGVRRRQGDQRHVRRRHRAHRQHLRPQPASRHHRRD